MKKYHFIAGLPRSGSTLVSSILNQNPRFSASITDSLVSYVRNIIRDSDQDSSISSLVPTETRKRIMHAIFDAYYHDHNPVCFNTNRSWAAHTDLIQDLYPHSRIILCIREVPWILDSFEQLHRKHPYNLKAVYGNQDMPTVYHRTNSLADLHAGGNGLVGMAVLNTKQALFSSQQHMIAVVDYETLCANPRPVMQKLYQFLDEPWFEHDFEDVGATWEAYDQALNMKDLHTVRPAVLAEQRVPILPQDLWERWSSESFWLHDFDHIKRKVLWLGP